MTQGLEEFTWFTDLDISRELIGFQYSLDPQDFEFHRFHKNHNDSHGYQDSQNSKRPISLLCLDPLHEFIIIIV